MTAPSTTAADLNAARAARIAEEQRTEKGGRDVCRPAAAAVAAQCTRGGEDYGQRPLPPVVTDLPALLDEVSGEFLSGCIDETGAVQRLVDGGCTRRGAEGTVAHWCGAEAGDLL